MNTIKNENSTNKETAAPTNPVEISFKDIVIDYKSGIPNKVQSAQERSIEALKGLIHSIIKRYFSEYAKDYYSELMQEGVIGILKGLPQYVPEKSAPSTFFYWRIKYEIQAFVNSGILGTTEYYATITQKIKKAEAILKNQNTQYTCFEIADQTGLSPRVVKQTMSIMSYQDRCCLSPEQNRFADTAPSPEEMLLRKEMIQEVNDSINTTLTNEEKFIIKNLIGINNEKKCLKYKEIAEILGITKEEVRLKRNKAIKRMKNL